MKRMLDDDQAPEAVRNLLRAAKAPRAPTSREIEEMVAWSGSLGTGGTGGPDGSWASSSLPGGASGWTLTAVAAVVLGGALTWGRNAPEVQSPPVVSAPTEPPQYLPAQVWRPPLDLPPSEAVQTQALELSASLASDRIQRPARTRRPRRRQPPAPVSDSPTPPPAPEPSPDLSEVELLDRARALLKAQPAAALAVLHRHQSLYPVGTLADERDFLIIRGAMASGRPELAQDTLQNLETRSPSSVYLPRLRIILEGGQ